MKSFGVCYWYHYIDVIMSMMASQITGISIVTQPFVQAQIKENIKVLQGIHQWRVNSLHKGPVMQKMFSFDDVIMMSKCHGVGVWSMD